MKQLLISILLVTQSFLGFSQHKVEITASNLKTDVYYLASDSLKGRKPGTKGADLAASYIREHFKNYGLKLLGEDGYQYFDIVTDVAAGPQNSLEFDNFHGMLNQEYTPLAYSSSKTVIAPVVFTGYGFDIDQDSLKWNDYADNDVKGKWVMLFRGDPEMDKQDSKFIPFTEIRGKILVAKDHGAAGVLVVSPAGVDKDDKLIGLHSENNDVTSGIPVINITREVGNKILASTGYKLDSLENILNRTHHPKLLKISMMVSATTDLVLKKARTANVIGMIEGKDPALKDEYIVVGAHYDHLGFGGQGSGSRMPDTVAVHYGADDNASGTAMVIEMAGKLKSIQKDLKRSIILVAFTGEEMGLLGSRYFADHSPVDMKKIKAMFNFDMIGRFDKSKGDISVGGTGTSAEADSIVKIYEKGLPFTVTHSPDGYGPSDHASFYTSNIPVFYFTTGAHTDYHTPFDQASKLDYATEKVIGDFAFNLIRDVDRMSHPLTFKESGKKVSEGRGGRRLKVTLGIMPDFAGTEKKGLRVDGVTKEGPADKGGMLKGDIIISINGMPVGNIYEYMTRLGKLKSGQTISVEVLRKEKHEVLIIRL